MLEASETGQGAYLDELLSLQRQSIPDLCSDLNDRLVDFVAGEPSQVRHITGLALGRILALATSSQRPDAQAGAEIGTSAIAIHAVLATSKRHFIKRRSRIRHAQKVNQYFSAPISST